MRDRLGSAAGHDSGRNSFFLAHTGDRSLGVKIESGNVHLQMVSVVDGASAQGGHHLPLGVVIEISNVVGHEGHRVVDSFPVIALGEVVTQTTARSVGEDLHIVFRTHEIKHGQRKKELRRLRQERVGDTQQCVGLPDAWKHPIISMGSDQRNSSTQTTAEVLHRICFFVFLFFLLNI